MTCPDQLNSLHPPSHLPSRHLSPFMQNGSILWYPTQVELPIEGWESRIPFEQEKVMGMLDECEK